MDHRPPDWLPVAAILLSGWALPAGASASCNAALGAPALADGPLKTVGTGPAATRIEVLPGHAYLVEVDERDNDALVEILDSANHVIARADHPERRTGTRRAVLSAEAPRSLVVRVTGKEHAGAAGTATVRLFDLAALGSRPECTAIMKALAAADADYAAGGEISRTHSASPSHGDARAAYLRAAEEYATAVNALSVPEDRSLRGETALALAGVEYFDLQDWVKAAEWAETASETLGPTDAYRHARAEALTAAAWIELGSSTPAAQTAGGSGVHSTALLARARSLLQHLSRFHLERGERYDAALQLNNVALTYYYEGRYAHCVSASVRAGAVFGAIHETLRRALAWQNQALCEWGLGRLPEALREFDRARRDIGEQPYPRLHLILVNNTALANYAVGRFDASLRLLDHALTFAQEIQAEREEGLSLYGIGVTYYALGDRSRAREFLERSLAIRSVALDGRGRMTTLRALANVDAEQGRVQDAIAFDREALSLAVAPPSVARIRVNLAAHTAAAGRLSEAKAQLDELISSGARGDRLIQAEALLRRAVLLREMGKPRDALADLALARPRLHVMGDVQEEFEADLEESRALRMSGQPGAALRAVERAIGHSDAVRLQSANPELRAQLQTPLRPAYELELELLRRRYEAAAAAGRDKEASAIAIEAFGAADASRAQSLGDVAAQKYPLKVRRALEPEFHRREQLYRELAARRFALDEVLDRSGSGDPHARRLMSDIAELERQADAVNTVIAGRATSAGTGPRSGSLRAGTARASLPRIPADTALVSYWLGSESAYAWVLLPGGIHWVRLPSSSDIADQALAFHRSLTRLVDVPLERRLLDARTLYGMIIRPLEPWLSGVRQWVVIPDGALDYVAFAALEATESKGDAFVAGRHDVALAPAAWMLDPGGARARRHGGRALLLVADPVYQKDDPRLAAIPRPTASSTPQAQHSPQEARSQYQRLPFTAQEAREIAAQFAPSDVEELVGLDATRDRLLSLDWSRYRFIHIATHGVADAQVPQLSALILGSYDRTGRAVDGAVRLADLSLLSLSADVAVLSACDTALGKEVPSEGLVGIGSTMLARGAGAVVASLWPVSDEIGARLMTEFYRHLLRDSMSPAAALGAGMRSVLSGGTTDPALWAAYQVLVVELGPGSPVRAVAEPKRAGVRGLGGGSRSGSRSGHGDAAAAQHPAALSDREAARRSRFGSGALAQGSLPASRSQFAAASAAESRDQGLGAGAGLAVLGQQLRDLAVHGRDVAAAVPGAGSARAAGESF